MPEETVAIPKALVISLINYLATRPYSEVASGIPALQMALNAAPAPKDGE